MKTIKKISESLFNLAVEGKLPASEEMPDIKKYLKQYERHRKLLKELPATDEYSVEDIKNLHLLQGLYDAIYSVPAVQWVLEPEIDLEAGLKDKILLLFDYLNSKKIPFNEYFKKLLIGIDPACLVPGLTPGLGGKRISLTEKDEIESVITRIHNSGPDQDINELVKALREFLDNEENIKS